MASLRKELIIKMKKTTVIYEEHYSYVESEGSDGSEMFVFGESTDEQLVIGKTFKEARKNMQTAFNADNDNFLKK